jgi:hypothetical protein
MNNDQLMNVPYYHDLPAGSDDTVSNQLASTFFFSGFGVEAFFMDTKQQASNTTTNK